jgi:hypothetical protein
MVAKRTEPPASDVKRGTRQRTATDRARASPTDNRKPGTPENLRHLRVLQQPVIPTPSAGDSRMGFPDAARV